MLWAQICDIRVLLLDGRPARRESAPNRKMCPFTRPRHCGVAEAPDFWNANCPQGIRYALIADARDYASNSIGEAQREEAGKRLGSVVVQRRCHL